MRFFTARYDQSHASEASSGRRRIPGALTGQESANPNARRQPGEFFFSLPPVQSLRTLEQTHQLGQQLLGFLGDPSVRVLRVDLVSIKWVSSELLSQFARLHYRASQEGKRVILENASEVVREVFHVTRFDRFFELNSERELLDSRNQMVEAESFV
jgi:anti-anti-sigma regulatory factor